MVKIVLLAEQGCISSGVIGFLDFLAVANVWWQVLGEGSGDPLFESVMVTVDGNPVQGNGGIELKPRMAMDQVEDADLIMVPALFPPFDMKNLRIGKICQWLRQRHSKGDCIAAGCTGTFFLAEAGLLDGKIATTNWLFTGLFRVEYPEVDLCVDRLITEEDRLICAGAASAYLDLCLYIIEKFGSATLASKCSKNFLVDPARRQSTYATHDFWKNHADKQVLEAQLWMEEHYPDRILIDELAQKVGISPRHFVRRFKHATGETPVAYLQHLRIENAKERLETTVDTVNEITWSVGYEDVNSFRRLFIKHTGIPPKEYRNKFSHFSGNRVMNESQQDLQLV